MNRIMSQGLVLIGLLLMLSAPIYADSHMQDRDRDQDRMHDMMNDSDRDRDRDRDRDQDRDRDRLQQQDDRVYGWEIMSEQERMEHRNMMRSFTTEAEREKYRLEHHRKMQERAMQLGIELEEVPPPRGMMMR